MQLNTLTVKEKNTKVKFVLRILQIRNQLKRRIRVRIRIRKKIIPDPQHWRQQ
jgi:hypothetical protein